MVANTPALRLLTVLEAFSGFAIFTLSVSYLLGVYAALASVNVLAVRVDAYFRHGGVHEMDLGRDDVRESLLRWSEETTVQLLAVLQAHFQYPILHYFRSTDPRRSLVVQFGHLLKIHHVVDGEDPAEGRLEELRTNPSLRALSEIVKQYLEEVSSLVATDTGGPDRSDGEMERTYRRLLEYMGYPREDA